MRYLLLLLASLILFALALPARAQTSTSFTYEGHLLANGNPATAKYDSIFKLYDATSGGTQYGSTVTVNDLQVTNGVFNASVDFGAGAFDGNLRYLDIQVRLGTSSGAYTTLTPRQFLGATPFALSLRPGAMVRGNTITPNTVTVRNPSTLDNAAGLLGELINATPTTSSAAVRGNNNGTNGKGHGVMGTAKGVNSVGVGGYSDSGNGVYGESVDGIGTYGESRNADGVFGYSSNSIGVFGSGPYGVRAYGTNQGVWATGANVGVYAETTSGIGVSGTSTSGMGIYGNSSSNYGVYGYSGNYDGVHGYSNTGNGVSGSGSAGVYGTGIYYGTYGSAPTGVYGNGTGSTSIGVNGQGGSYGVYGSTRGTAGGNYSAGVYGTASNCPAVRGDGTGTGQGGYFSSGYYGIQGISVGYGGGGGSAGVYGSNGGGPGVWGVSSGGNGVYGYSTHDFGVQGASDGTGGGSAGVYGSNPGGPGVWGNSTGGNGVFGHSTIDYGVQGISDKSDGAGVSGTGHHGIQGIATNPGPDYAGYFYGDVHVSGNVSKSSGAFKIDHPLDPANKYLQHSFVESPDMKNIYDGVVTTDATGSATVTLPNWFMALNRDFRYQLTCIGQFAQAIVTQKIVANAFVIKTDKPNVEVDWQVTGIRHDAYANDRRIQVEVDKQPVDKGKYLYPQGFVKNKDTGTSFTAWQIEPPLPPPPTPKISPPPLPQVVPGKTKIP